MQTIFICLAVLVGFYVGTLYQKAMIKINYDYLCSSCKLKFLERQRFYK